MFRSVVPVSGCLVLPSPSFVTTSSSNDADAAAVARRRFDANKVVITVGGMHRKATMTAATNLASTVDAYNDWEKRLSAGRQAIEHEAQLMQGLTTNVAVVPEEPTQLSKTPRRTSIKRSKVVQTLSVPVEVSSTDADGNGGQQQEQQSIMVRRLIGGGLQKIQSRLKPVLSIPMEAPHQELNGDSKSINGPNKKNGTRRRPPDGSDQPDGSVVSSYQPLADLDLDDDAIMV